MKRKFLFWSIAMLTMFCFFSCKDDDDDGKDSDYPAPEAMAVDDNDKILAELYFRTFGYLFTDGKADTDVERVLELQNQLVDNNPNVTRGVIGGTTALVKFVNIIRLNQNTTAAKVVSTIVKQGWTPEKLFQNVKDRDDGSRYGYTNAQSFYDDLLAGRLNKYAGNIYNDLYNSTTEFADELDHPMKMAVAVAPALADCAKDIIMAVYPNDMISWGQMSNDLVNSIEDLIKSRGDNPEDIVSTAKSILSVAAHSMQLGVDDCENIDSDVIDHIIGKSTDAVKEYIYSVEHPDESLNSAWSVFANWVYDEVPNDPNSEWHKFLRYRDWYYYQTDQYYRMFLDDDNSVTINVYTQPNDQGWVAEYNGTYAVSGDHISITSNVTGTMQSVVALMSTKTSGEHQRLILSYREKSIEFRNLPDENWGKTDFPYGIYEFFITKEDGSVTNVNDMNMTFSSDGYFKFVTNTVYFNRFEGVFSYKNGVLSVNVSKCWNNNRRAMVSASGVVSVPCVIQGGVLTVDTSSYVELSDGTNVKIPSGNYRLK